MTKNSLREAADDAMGRMFDYATMAFFENHKRPMTEDERQLIKCVLAAVSAEAYVMGFPPRDIEVDE